MQAHLLADGNYYTSPQHDCEAEIRKLRKKVAHYIREARYHRDCERLCARAYDTLKAAQTAKG